MSAREVVVTGIVITASVVGIGAAVTSSDTVDWVKDGPHCFVNIHTHAQSFWVDDYTTVKRYCEGSR